MIPLDNAVTARLESHGLRFEILVDPELADKMRHGAEGIDIEDAVAALNVYENASHGDKSPDEDLLKVFKSTVFEEVAKQYHADSTQLETTLSEFAATADSLQSIMADLQDGTNQIAEAVDASTTEIVGAAQSIQGLAANIQSINTEVEDNQRIAGELRVEVDKFR